MAERAADDYKQEIRETYSAGLRDEDGNLPKHYEPGIEFVANTRRELEAAYRSKGKGRLTAIAQLSRQYAEGLKEMGLTAMSAPKLADTIPEPLARVTPLRTDGRAQEVADLLLCNCALPVDSATIAVAREAKEAGLTFLEVVEMRAATTKE